MRIEESDALHSAPCAQDNVRFRINPEIQIRNKSEIQSSKIETREPLLAEEVRAAFSPPAFWIFLIAHLNLFRVSGFGFGFRVSGFGFRVFHR